MSKYNTIPELSHAVENIEEYKISDVVKELAVLSTEFKLFRSSTSKMMWWIIGLLFAIGGTNFYFNKTMLDRGQDGRTGTNKQGNTFNQGSHSQSPDQSDKAKVKFMVTAFIKPDNKVPDKDGVLRSSD